jgi:hypothetical protein
MPSGGRVGGLVVEDSVGSLDVNLAAAQNEDAVLRQFRDVRLRDAPVLGVF